MTDLFAVLGQPRRPWLEPDTLKEKYHELSRTAHPDLPNDSPSGRFDAVNEAYRVLLDTKLRLQHLLALESGEAVATGRAVPADLQERFLQLGALTQNVRALAQKMVAAQSGLSRSLLRGELKVRQDEIARLQNELDAAWASAQEEIQRVDQIWDDDRATALEHLPPIYERLSYLTRWREQIREMQSTWLVRVESHTYWHPNFRNEKRRLSPPEYTRFVQEQLSRSKSILDRQLHHAVHSLAWPYGIVDSQLEDAARRAGYSHAYAFDGRLATVNDDAYAIHRIPVPDSPGLGFIPCTVRDASAVKGK